MNDTHRPSNQDDDIVTRLVLAQVASCGCMAKTPDAKYHRRDCLYAVLSDAIDAIQGASAEPPAATPDRELAEALEAAVIFLAPGIAKEPLLQAAQRLRSLPPDATPAHTCGGGIVRIGTRESCSVCYPPPVQMLPLSDETRAQVREAIGRLPDAGPQLEDFAADLASARPCGVVVDDVDLSTAVETSDHQVCGTCSGTGWYSEEEPCDECAAGEQRHFEKTGHLPGCGVYEGTHKGPCNCSAVSEIPTHE